MSDYATVQEQVAYLLWQVDRGYIRAEDRAIGTNWFQLPEAELHPDDRAARPHWMALAAEVIDLVRATDSGRPEADKAADMPSYHDLHITTADIPRTSIFNLPYGFEVKCMRTTGWVLYDNGARMSPHLPVQEPRQLAGEYDRNWLVLDVDGVVICDSRNTEPDDDE